MRFHTYSADETRTLGRRLGQCAYPGLTILLRGGLGMGKTVLTQGIGDGLGIKRVKSPTFIIVAEHEGRLPLIHADLYRLSSARDIDALDLESYIEEGCLLVVEWSERWHEQPDSDAWRIVFTEPEESESERIIDITSCGAKADEALEAAKDLSEREV